jgi:hypothetical protein
MSGAAEVFPNIAAEEGDWRALGALPAVRGVAELFASLVRDAPALDGLPRSGELAAWLNTPEAAEAARARGLALYGAPPVAVAAVHDKAFAWRAAREHGLEPALLRDRVQVLEPAELADPPAALARIEAALARWPAPLREHAVLKPRLGTSGRGRVRLPVRDPGVLTQLAARGGALLEPWLAREVDLSVQLLVAADGSARVLASPELLVTRSGSYRGHRGRLSADGRITSGTPYDTAMRSAAERVARSAAEQGYRGPCAIDGFAFRSPGGESVELRPVVELNARFTTGVLAALALARHLPQIQSALGAPTEAPWAFQFALAAPRGGWPAAQHDRCVLALAGGAGIVVTRAEL